METDDKFSKYRDMNLKSIFLKIAVYLIGGILGAISLAFLPNSINYEPMVPKDFVVKKMEIIGVAYTPRSDSTSSPQRFVFTGRINGEKVRFKCGGKLYSKVLQEYNSGRIENSKDLQKIIPIGSEFEVLYDRTFKLGSAFFRTVYENVPDFIEKNNNRMATQIIVIRSIQIMFIVYVLLFICWKVFSYFRQKNNISKGRGLSDAQRDYLNK
jgi:hypothetical protein